jgi:hypothetical protein
MRKLVAMAMSIYMVADQAGLVEGTELRTDFRLQLPPAFDGEGGAEYCRLVRVEISVASNKPWDQVRLQHGHGITQRQMQPDSQRRRRKRDGHCASGAGLSHHQTCRGDGSGQVRL